MPLRRIASLGTLAAFVVLAAGCGNSSGPSAPAPSGGTTADFTYLVQASYPSGAVLPTTVEADASLLVAMKLPVLNAAGALFQSGGTFVDAGKVTLYVNGVIFPGATVDTLARLSVPVNFTPWYVYTSLANFPYPPPVVFDGTTYDHFVVSGAGSFAALEDSVQSVTLPVVTAPVAAAQVPRNANLTVSWSDAGTDTTVYVLCVMTSASDTSKTAPAVLVRDAAGTTTIPTARLQTLPAGSARLSVGRYRLVRHMAGARKVDLVCEAAALRTVALQ